MGRQNISSVQWKPENNETRRRLQSIDAIIMLRREAGKMTRHRDDNDQFKFNFNILIGSNDVQVDSSQN